MKDSVFFCISDIHFTHSNFEKKFEKIKNKINNRKCSTIYLLGDIVDEEFEYYSDLTFKKFLSQLNRFFQFCKEISLEVIVTPGNHDDIFFKEFGEKFKIKIEKFDLRIINSQEFVFLHGHRFDKFFWGHRVLRFFNLKNNFKHKFKKNLNHFENSFSSRLNNADKYVNKISAQKNKTIILGHFNEDNSYYKNSNTFVLLKSFQEAPQILEISAQGYKKI